MKKMPRNKASLLNTGLSAYAAAAAATTFGAAVADAEIHYSGAVQKIVNPDGFASAKFPLSNGASIKLYNVSSQAGFGTYNYAGFSVLGAPVSHGFRGGNAVGAARLPDGTRVS